MNGLRCARRDLRPTVSSYSSELLELLELLLVRCNPFMAPRISTAFVLGAGLGTRLRPLTDLVPKPLLPIFGKPIVTFALDHLIAHGVERFVINSHHLAGQISRLFSPNADERMRVSTGFYRGKEVQLIYEPTLLETGGGIRNAAGLIGDESFFVYSGDLLTDIDLGRLAGCAFFERLRRDFGFTNDGFVGTDISFDFGSGLVVDVRQMLKTGVAGGYDFANVSVWNRGCNCADSTE